MPETWSEWLGISGFILALISLFWQIWKYRDEHIEKVSGKISFKSDGKGRWVALKIVNCGRVPVYLEKVQLCWGNPSAKVGSSHVSVLFELQGPQHEPLAPGAGAMYGLDAMNPVLQPALILPENNVWVSVWTPRREIMRLEGNKVLPGLRLACAKNT